MRIKMKFFVMLLMVSAVNLSCENDVNQLAAPKKNSAISTSSKATAQALTAEGEFTDWSGKIKIKAFSGEVVNCQHCTGSVTIDPAYVLVGGSAWIESWEKGAFLTESRPDAGLTTWYASSKDHLDADSHTLKIVAFGMRLEGLTASQLRSYMNVNSATGIVDSHPVCDVLRTNGYQMIGGGAKVNYSGYGNMLYESKPFNIGIWRAKSKDHLKGDAASITAYTIGIVNPVPGFGDLLIDIASFTPHFYDSQSSGYYSASGYGTRSMSIPSGWVVTCPGGNTDYSGQGRMLMGIRMDPGNYVNVTVSTKDHRSGSSGYLNIFAMIIQKKYL